MSEQVDLAEVRRVVAQLQKVGDLSVTPPPVWLVRDLLEVVPTLIQEVERLRGELQRFKDAVAEQLDAQATLRGTPEHRAWHDRDTLRARVAELKAALWRIRTWAGSHTICTNPGHRSPAGFEDIYDAAVRALDREP